jgi:chorismate mutase
VLALPVVDAAVLGAIASDALRPAVIDAVLDEVFRLLTPDAQESTLAALQADLRRVDLAIGNLTAAIEQGGAMPALVAKLAERQTEREGVVAAIAAAKAVDQLAVDRQAVERQVRAKVADWQGLLTRQVEDGRQLLRELLDGPLRFTPEGKDYRFEGTVKTGELIAALVTPPCVASPTASGVISPADPRVVIPAA